MILAKALEAKIKYVSPSDKLRTGTARNKCLHRGTTGVNPAASDNKRKPIFIFIGIPARVRLWVRVIEFII